MRAATADPADDAVRLVYADWLEEQPGAAATAHAQFVRLQVERARLALTDPRRAELVAAEAALARPNRRHWNGRLHRRLAALGMPGKVDSRRGYVRGWNYHRGMVGHVTVDAAALLDGAELVAALGPVEWLTLLGGVGSWSWFTPNRAEWVAARLPVVRLLTFRGPLRNRADLPDRLLDSWPALAVVDVRRTDVNEWSPAGPGRPSGVVVRRQRRAPAVEVVDPHDHWPDLRPWFAALTGEAPGPPVHHGATW